MTGICVNEEAINSTDKVWLGVHNATSTTKYCYADGSTYIETPVIRANGWHRLEWDYSSGINFVLRIDNIIVYVGTRIKQFKAIKMGNWEVTSATAYFDDVYLMEVQ